MSFKYNFLNENYQYLIQTSLTFFLIAPINLSHESHNTPVSYPTMHHFVTEMWTRMHVLCCMLLLDSSLRALYDQHEMA